MMISAMLTRSHAQQDQGLGLVLHAKTSSGFNAKAKIFGLKAKAEAYNITDWIRNF